jgi:hypothetical protein
MPRVLDAMPPVPPSSRQSTTDYAQYLDGRIWCIDETDVPMPLYRLRATLVSKANRRGLKLATRLIDQRLYVHAES